MNDPSLKDTHWKTDTRMNDVGTDMAHIGSDRSGANSPESAPFRHRSHREEPDHRLIARLDVPEPTLLRFEHEIEHFKVGWYWSTDPEAPRLSQYWNGPFPTKKQAHDNAYLEETE